MNRCDASNSSFKWICCFSLAPRSLQEANRRGKHATLSLHTKIPNKFMRRPACKPGMQARETCPTHWCRKKTSPAERNLVPANFPVNLNSLKFGSHTRGNTSLRLASFSWKIFKGLVAGTCPFVCSDQAPLNIRHIVRRILFLNSWTYRQIHIIILLWYKEGGGGDDWTPHP